MHSDYTCPLPSLTPLPFPSAPPCLTTKSPSHFALLCFTLRRTGPLKPSSILDILHVVLVNLVLSVPFYIQESRDSGRVSNLSKESDMA